MKKIKLITCVGIGVLFAFVMKNANAMMIETDQTKYYNKSAIIPKNEILGSISKTLEKTIVTHYSDGSSTYSIRPNNKVISCEFNERIFKFSGVVGAMVEDLDNDFHAFDAGSSISLESSQTFTDEITYSEQISSACSVTFGREIGFEVGYGVASAETSTSFSVSAELSASVSTSTTYSCSATESRTKTYAVAEKGLYRLQKRALFNVYIYQQYTTVYDVTYFKNVPSSKFAYYTVDKTSYILEYIPGSEVEGLFKYSLSDDYGYVIDQEYANSFYNSNVDIYNLD